MIVANGLVLVGTECENAVDGVEKDREMSLNRPGAHQYSWVENSEK